jgi:hypothetical protein
MMVRKVDSNHRPTIMSRALSPLSLAGLEAASRGPLVGRGTLRVGRLRA